MMTKPLMDMTKLRLNKGRKPNKGPLLVCKYCGKKFKFLTWHYRFCFWNPAADKCPRYIKL